MNSQANEDDDEEVTYYVDGFGKVQYKTTKKASKKRETVVEL